MDGIDLFLQRYPDSPIILDLLGTLDAAEIRARVREVDPQVDKVFFFAVSVGAFDLLPARVDRLGRGFV